MEVTIKMHTLEEQLALEEYYKNYAREAFRIRIQKEIDSNRGDKTPIAKGIMTYYKETMAENVENFVKIELAPKRGVRRSYNEFVKTSVEEHGIEHTVMVFCAFCFESCLQSLVADNKFSASSLAIMMGKRIYYELALEAYTKVIPKGRTKEIERQLDKRVQTRYKEAFIKRAFENEGFHWYEYNTRVLADLGAQLIYIFVSCTGLAEFTSEEKRRYGVLTLISWQNTPLLMYLPSYRQIRGLVYMMGHIMENSVLIRGLFA